MAKKDKRRTMAESRPSTQMKEEKPTTLKDLLRPEMLEKLQTAGQELKTAEEQRKEQIRKQEEEARQAEKKRLENDFEYLLNNSKMDWKSNKG